MKRLVSPAATSPAVAAAMRGNKAKGTRPELTVRAVTFSLGYRYRLHDRRLPGKPDLVFPRLRKVVFVHGCFWHQHKNKRCPLVSTPRKNYAYWKPKLERNVDRHVRQRKLLRSHGWKTKVIWECQTRDRQALTRQLIRYLES
jgi:DNA mismatch endonuclease (patch repair protein)